MTESLCSRCNGPLDTEGAPKWCKKCRAAYQREYQELRKEMAAGKGFHAGCEAMRQALLGKLDGLPDTALTHYAEVQRWIKEFPAPSQG